MHESPLGPLGGYEIGHKCFALASIDQICIGAMLSIIWLHPSEHTAR